MTKVEVAYHEHQRTEIKTAEQKQAYRAWLMAIEAKKIVQQESTGANEAVETAIAKAKGADYYYVEAIKEEREAWLKYEEMFDRETF